MPVARTIARNTALQLGGHAVALAVSVSMLSVVARYLGVRGYGVYSVATAAFGLAVAAVGTGLDTVAVRTFAADGADRLLFRRVLGLRIAATAAAAVVVAALVWLLPLGRDARLAVAVLAVAATIGGAQAAFTTLLQARQAFGVPVLADTLARVLGLTGFLVLAFALAPLPHDRGIRVVLVLACSTVAAALILAGTVLYLRCRGVPCRPAYDGRTWRSLTRQAAPLGIATVLGIASYRLDILVLAALKGSAAAGIYGLAYRFVDASIPIAVFFVGAAFPAFSRSLADGSFERLHAQRALDFLLLVSLPLCLGGVAIAPQLVHVFAGPAYARADVPLRLLLLSLPFTFVTMFLVSLAIASGRQGTVAWLTGGGVVLNLLLNLALVPRYSYVASASATLASEVAGTIALVALAHRWFGLRLGLRTAVRGTAAALVSAAAASLLVPLGIATAVATGIVVYAAGALLLRVVTLPELRLLAGRAS
ncbi:MAG TPA: oligosaccharide flippase family protein [Gaiellaceae bacterium]